MEPVHPGDDEQPTPIKSFVFLDLETSSLIPMEHPKITEMCLMAVHREALLSRSRENEELRAAVGRTTDAGATGIWLPRVVDKLTLCVYPNKLISPKSFELTQLDNHSLTESGKAIFDADAVTMLRLFISRQEGPVCLVAHNGDRFDFRLLRTELQKLGERLGEDILCADSLKAYAETDGARAQAELTSYALGKIYQRTFGDAIIPNAHSAEGDVIALIRITLARADAMCKWMDKNAVSFRETELYYIPSPSKKDRCKPKPFTSTCIQSP